jgi:hypothetical protein
LLGGVLYPDDRDTLFASLVDEPSDVGDDRVALVCIGHDPLLDVDHHQGGVGSI